MKKCTYCGKEYSDDVASCSVDGMILQGDEMLAASAPVLEVTSSLPQITSPPPVPSTVGIRTLTDRQLRIVEVVLVCVLVFGGSILTSIYSLFGERFDSSIGSLRWTNSILRECSALGLLWYVLVRRSKSLADLGLAWKRTDIPWSFALYFAGSIAVSVIYRAIYYSGLTSMSIHRASAAVGQHLFGGGVFVSTLVLQCINPFFEELIVRAYVITEVRGLTNSLAKAIACSVLLQMSYHFYQGIPLAISYGPQFLIWSFYYAKTNRVMPIILAQFYADVGATLWYFFHHY